MVDSLLNLGAFSLLQPRINWKQRPKTGFDSALQVQEFIGTSNEIIEYDVNLPEKFEFTITNRTKAEEKQIEEDFNGQKGKHGCFWFYDVAKRFTLDGDISAADLTITIRNNTFISKGFERFYIETKSGDKFTRKINSSAVNGNQIDLSIASSLGSIVLKTDIFVFTLLHLCRFDNDRLSLRSISHDVSETGVSILQLPKEQIAI